MRLATTFAVTMIGTATLIGGVLIPGSALAAHTASRATTTHRVVVRPVDASGQARPGWTVHRMKGVTVDCGGAAAAAVDNGIYECFPTAAYLPACWPSSHHTVLCLRDARERKLVRVRYTGRLGAATQPRLPSPQDLVLAGGQVCELRIGGAWGTLPTHPNWVGFYSCKHGSVYGPPSGDGVNRSDEPWTVHVWKGGTRHDVVRRSVVTAYFVGTHR